MAWLHPFFILHRTVNGRGTAALQLRGCRWNFVITPCVNWHPQLRTGGFCWSKVSTSLDHMPDEVCQLFRAISSQLRHVSTVRKRTMLNSNISPMHPQNMVNFGPQAAESNWRVWGTPANLNGILAALLHDTLVVGVSQTLQH